jgi:WD40 repeat protein
MYEEWREFEAVTALDISPDERLVVTGYHQGQVGLWSLRNGHSLKASNTIHHAAVLAVRCWRTPNKLLCAVTSDITGLISLVEYSKFLFSVNIKHRVLIAGELSVCPSYYPRIIPILLINTRLLLLAVLAK